MDYAIETGKSNMIKLVSVALDGNFQKFPNIDIYINPSAGPLPNEDETGIHTAGTRQSSTYYQSSTTTSHVNSDTLNNVIGSGLKICFPAQCLKKIETTFPTNEKL